MALVGYQPVQSDGGPFQANFQDDKGRSFLMFGPEAEQAAQGIDQRKQYLAQNDAGAAGSGPESRSDVNYDMSGGSSGAPNMSMTEANGGANMSTPTGEAVRAPEPQVPPPSPEPARAQPQSAPAPNATSEPGTQAHLIGRDEKTGHSLYKMPDGSVWENVPASAGSKGGLILKTQSEKGGIPEDPNYTAGMERNYENQQRLIQMSYDTGMKQASYEAGYNQTLLKAQQAAALEAQAKQDAAQKEVDTYMARRQQAVDEYNKFKIDPKDPGAGTATTIGLILGSFGAALTNTPNFALQIVQNRIQNSIHAQEAQMKVLGDKADNALVDLKMKLGSLDAAKSAYASIVNGQAATQLKLLANKTQNEQMRNNYLDVANKLEAQNLQKTEEDRIRRLGEVTKNFQNMPKTSGTSGGLRPTTLGTQQAAATLDKTIAGTEATKNKANTPGAIPRSLQQRDASTESALDMNERLLKLYGVKGNDRVGYLEGVGKGVKNTLDPSKQREIDAIYKTYLEERHKAITGTAPTESTYKEIEHTINSTSTAQKIADLQNDKETLHKVREYNESQRTNQPEFAAPAPEE